MEDYPTGHSFSRRKGCVTYYKILLYDHQALEATETMEIHQDLHIKLFIKVLSIPLLQFFKRRKENFLAYFKSER